MKSRIFANANLRLHWLGRTTEHKAIVSKVTLRVFVLDNLPAPLLGKALFTVPSDLRGMVQNSVDYGVEIDMEQDVEIL